ncbi:hypothetical protein BKA65DRAFT_578573 [Rhexocercosporidium sp. MPI-PUGE-AT-0058]|nr:hypothetical protein BKA65DRAFT_578573 [Rhexocercosporidium sp. MPI-PUGE-AT-0058]
MRVLISGSGIAGPTLAFFLSKTNAKITVVENAPTILPHGQNVDIQGSAVKLINKMGLMDEVRRHNTTEKGTQFIDSKGRPFAPLPVKEGSRTSLTSEFEILRGDLAKILHEATKDLGNVEYLFGTTIKRVLSNDGDVVKVELSDGDVREYDLLVASDGAWSKVRKQCFPPDALTVVDKAMYVAYFTIPRQPEDNDWWNIYWGLGSRIISTRPDPYGTIRVLLSYMPGTEAQKKVWQDAARSGRQTQQELLRKEFADAGWQAERFLGAMNRAPDFYFQDIKQIRLAQWSISRVVCVGDTAYAPTPLTGMGTSLAITGAYVLAGELSKLSPAEHPARALEAYDAVFRPFVDQMQHIPFLIPSVAHPSSALKRWLVQSSMAGVARLAAIPWLQSSFKENAKEMEDDFTLPVYPVFEEGGGQA